MPILEEKKPSLLKIILGFNLHHIDADLSVLEDINTQDDLDALALKHDPFEVIAKMKEFHMMNTAFDQFYESLNGYPEIKANLDEVKAALGI